MGHHAQGGIMHTAINMGVAAATSALAGGAMSGPSANLLPNAAQQAGAAIAGATSNGVRQAAAGGVLSGISGGRIGDLQGAWAIGGDKVKGALTPSLPKPPGMPRQPNQAQDATPSVGGYNMDLAQKAAMSLGGTMFTTPSQWNISNRGQSSTLVGA